MTDYIGKLSTGKQAFVGLVVLLVIVVGMVKFL